MDKLLQQFFSFVFRVGEIPLLKSENGENVFSNGERK